jgi:autotransporter adhesin
VKKTLLPLCGLLLAAAAQAQTDRVGVGTTTPRAGLDVSHPDGLVATGTYDQGNTDNLPSGSGTRLMWIPKKAAFRAGYVYNTEWDYANVGFASAALGEANRVSGNYAFAAGQQNTASGNYSAALGYQTTASGRHAVALGKGNTASGESSVALGLQNTASGTGSVALGVGSTASEIGSVALGQQNTASGSYSTALGSLSLASGAYSTALGYYASTNGQMGSLVMSDASTGNRLTSSAAHEFSARYAGGYRLFSNAAMNRGLFLTGANRLGLGSTDTAPRAGLDVSHDDGLVATGTFGSGNTDNLPSGSGTRLMWIPKKAAFRAGYADGTKWDLAQIGTSSVALGSATVASGESSTAMGYLSTASGVFSTALGQNTTASGDYATALGVLSTASGASSAAIGDSPTASGASSVALGNRVVASGNQSHALGNYASTNGQVGSLVMGDYSTNTLLTSSAANEFSARFAGGYRLFSNPAMNQGLFLTSANRLGLGSTAPRAGLDVNHPDGLVATGGIGQGSTDNLPTGAGDRLLWIPRKSAFRAGGVNGTQWNAANIGDYSVGLGRDVVASGLNATALGYRTTASGNYSVAVGFEATADAQHSTAIGNYVTTFGQAGSMVLGDNNGSADSPLGSSTSNQFTARFTNGYRLFTSVSPLRGVTLSDDGGSWNVISDSTQKAGFRPADGAQFLQKIARMRLGSWHYKGQDARTMRHYGPMAQDFFSAFGHDGVGTVGCDTLINQADFDGVNLIAIQALARENEARKAENEALRTENAELRRLLGRVVADVQALKATVTPAATASR